MEGDNFMMQYGFCIAMTSAVAVLSWEIFNLHFDVLRHSRKSTRLWVSALLFALICSFCDITVIERRIDLDWPRFMMMVSLAYFIHWIRSSRGNNLRDPHSSV